MARDVAVMLGVLAARVVVTDDPARRYGGHAWHLITVHDPDDPATAYRFVPGLGWAGCTSCSTSAPTAPRPAYPWRRCPGWPTSAGTWPQPAPSRPGRRTPTRRATVRTCRRTSSATPGAARTARSTGLVGNERPHADHTSTRIGWTVVRVEASGGAGGSRRRLGAGHIDDVGVPFVQPVSWSE